MAKTKERFYNPPTGYELVSHHKTNTAVEDASARTSIWVHSNRWVAMPETPGNISMGASVNWVGRTIVIAAQ